jgi:hypothetical protein
MIVQIKDIQNGTYHFRESISEMLQNFRNTYNELDPDRRQTLDEIYPNALEDFTRLREYYHTPGPLKPREPIEILMQKLRDMIVQMSDIRTDTRRFRESISKTLLNYKTVYKKLDSKQLKIVNDLYPNAQGYFWTLLEYYRTPGSLKPRDHIELLMQRLRETTEWIERNQSNISRVWTKLKKIFFS